jgi:hypothetical protein
MLTFREQNRKLGRPHKAGDDESGMKFPTRHRPVAPSCAIRATPFWKFNRPLFNNQIDTELGQRFKLTILNMQLDEIAIRNLD